MSDGAPSDLKDGEAEKQLDRLAEAWGVAVPPGARKAIVSYARQLLRWGERINLTGARSLRELLADHIPDSFALASRLAAGPAAELVADVGSGGGLPGIPLALLCSTTELHLFEPTGKKVAFLRTVIRELGLGDRVRVEATRLEGRAPALLFDAALSRATFPPARWLELGWTIVKPGGRLFALTSEAVEGWPSELEKVGATGYDGVPSAGGDAGRARRWITELRRRST